MIRLDKYLADMGIGTRSEVKKLIFSGKVRVDGSICKRPEQKIDQTQAQVCVNQEQISYVEYEYFMLNKPKGVVSATTDSRYPTVLDCIKEHVRDDLFPVGRLDLDTEGLLLITNDGALSHTLLSPSHHIPKTYEALIDGFVTEEDIRSFAEGIDIGEKRITRPAELSILKADVISHIRVTIYEGKYHQIKRMFEACGKKVLELKRLSMGKLCLDETLSPGEYRRLTKEEIAYLSGGCELNEASAGAVVIVPEK